MKVGFIFKVEIKVQGIKMLTKENRISNNLIQDYITFILIILSLSK